MRDRRSCQRSSLNNHVNIDCMRSEDILLKSCTYMLLPNAAVKILFIELFHIDFLSIYFIVYLLICLYLYIHSFIYSICIRVNLVPRACSVPIHESSMDYRLNQQLRASYQYSIETQDD